MADISITAASVLSSVPVAASNTVLRRSGIAGEAITAGQTVYVDTGVSPNVIKKADADAASPACDIAGIATNSASTGQPINYTYQDPLFTVGATLAIGDRLYASKTAGGITITAGDLTGTGLKVTVLGVMTTTTQANLLFVASAGVLP